MKYSKALVVLFSMLVGIWAVRLIQYWAAGRWGWVIVVSLIGIGCSAVVLHYLGNLKRKDQ